MAGKFPRPKSFSYSTPIRRLSSEHGTQAYTAADSIFSRLASPPPSNGTPATASPPSSKPGSPFVERSNPMGAGNAQTVTSKDPKAAAQAATDMKNVVRRKLTGYVGFANLPNQWHRKSVRKGFNFNVMVVGELYIMRRNKGTQSINELAR
jgi:septin 7